MSASNAPKKQAWSWRGRAFRGVVYQILAVGVIGAAIWFLASNTLQNMRVRGIQSGFDFLTQTAGFDIGESLFEFSSGEQYWVAFLVGLVNTLRVAIPGCILAILKDTIP